MRGDGPHSQQPLRVLHVIGDLDLGGAETLLYRLAAPPMAQLRHEVICLGPPGWYSRRLAEHGVTVHHLGMTSAWSALKGLGRLRSLIRDSGADVIQAWMYFANVLSGLLARRARIPVVWGIHGATLDHVGMPSRLCARAGGAGARWLSSFVINCSERSAELHGRLGYSAVPGAVVPNGYDPAAFYADEASRRATRSALGIDADTFVIGSISRWHPDKDIGNLLSAARLAAGRGVPLRCLLIGRGLEPDNGELCALIRERGCEDLAIPLGCRGDVDALARAMDLHVLPSCSEAFPNVIAETMLSETPNAVTDVGDAAVMVGDNGWVAPPGDSAKLAEAIERAWREWRDEPGRWQQRRAAARRSIVDRFTFERMAAAYRRIWTDVAERSRQAPARIATKFDGP